MAGVYRPMTDRQLAVKVLTKGIRRRAIPGTHGNLQKLTEGELEYLRWLGEKVLAERGDELVAEHGHNGDTA